ncbi:haloalkane dehalogenase [Roseobacter sinensis]|uniref:Haloalkane dehalogenase n=1 Tax=Roseobacter sinensis TaxID=2931391 RepID=A0ABT3B922_9RHOB|nr:haloalkane dehalogenase [Roseobacter sp. WL0113]MCV3270065.1 haloalkane dehalogenase [Roseobacter sp. WL0113]
MRSAIPTLTAIAAFTACPTLAQQSLDRPAEIQIVKTANAEIAYYEIGNPEGKPVVFVHGLPFSSYIWRNVMTGLDRQIFRLIAVDLVGFGDSSGDGYGVTDQAAHLASFADALDLSDIIAVGHDWGAGIALVWAAQNAEDFAGFATMEGAMPPVYPRPTYDEMPERIAGLFRAMRDPGLGEENVLNGNLWLDRIMPTMTEKPMPEAVVAEYNRPFPKPESRQPILEMSRSLPIGGAPADVVATYSAAVTWWTTTDLPKLVLYAEPGRLYPEDLARWNEDNAKNVTLTNIGPGRHALQEEDPQAVADGLGDWLATLDN